MTTTLEHDLRRAMRRLRDAGNPPAISDARCELESLQDALAALIAACERGHDDDV